MQKALKQELTAYEEQRLLTACNNDQELFNRVLPFAGLVRLDTLGYPVVIPTGSVYVTQGSDRRETGTHYTPRSLTEEIVQYTLEPLVYEGVAEGKPKEQWKLKSAAELLKLKICDMAMGSGAFLVQTCRYLAERLVEAWENAEKANPGKVVTAPEGTLSKSRPEECVIPKDADERLMVARRIIADRCLYGVDKNPLAVEMAKLSLWLITLQKNRPFTFVDHALKCGDSLIGVTLEQWRYWNLDTSKSQEQSEQLDILTDIIRREIQQVIELRLQIESKPVLTTQDQKYKKWLLHEANSRINDLASGCNLLISSYLVNLPIHEQEKLRQRLLIAFQRREDVLPEDRAICPDLKKLRPFHWELEFPEVFVVSDLSLNNDKGSKKSTKVLTTNENQKLGFDAIVGNPPFMGGQKITGALGTAYRDFLVQWIANDKRGSADLCAYFFLRAKQLLNSNAGFGLIATNTIAQGDTREVALDQLVNDNCVINRAVPSRRWPGTASLEVAYVWLRQGNWQGRFILDEKLVDGITAFLNEESKIKGNPYRLIVNHNKSFKGACVNGIGFTLTPELAQKLIIKNNRNKDVLFPYLNGEDLNSSPTQSPSRWIINFFDWSLNADEADQENHKDKTYATDYPDCLAIVEEKVKPERTQNKSKNLREKWWQYERLRLKLYNAILGMNRVIVKAAVSPTWAFQWSNTDVVFDQKIVVLTETSFLILQSTIHWVWAIQFGSTLGKITYNYTPTDCFETFPFPTSTANLEEIGDRYYNHRQNIMQTRQEGLTKTYNRFHNPDETAADIQQLRELHIEMDNAVAAAYGWQDLELSHGFHQTKQGLRFTISETARREVLDRLLELNHQRYAEEVAQGLHDKGKKKGKIWR